MRRLVTAALLLALTLVPQACHQDDVLAPHLTKIKAQLGSSLTYKVAFESRGDVYVTNPDGSQARLTTSSGREPAWSPDGQRIAFSSGRDGHPEIYLMMAGGSTQTRLTYTASAVYYPGSPTWSPDGSKIAFSKDGHIFVIRADGSGLTQLTSGASFDDSPNWSPDGGLIAFSSDRVNFNHDIYVMNADGSGPTRLTDDPGWDGEPSWSPDGKRIAFTSFRDDSYEIYVMNADGSGQTRLTNDPAWDGQPSWSPDGRQIAFATYRASINGDVYLINADGSEPTRLTYNLAGALNPSWSPTHEPGKRSLTFATQPSETVAVNDALSPPVRVAVVDSLGHPVPGATDTVTLELGTNLTGATLRGTTKVAAVDGVATFGDLRLDRLGRAYTLAARVPSLNGVESHPFTVTSAVRLVFVGQPPQAVAANGVLSPPVRVALVDASGNPLPGAADTVTLALSANPSAAALQGTTSVAAQGGIATFADLRVDRPGDGFTLGATAAGRNPATSTAFAAHVTFASVEAGGAHSCSVTTSGAAYCWGSSSWGEAGDGSQSRPNYRTSPALVVGGLDFAMVSVGGAHTCGVTTSGAGYCWGFGYWGQRGDGGLGQSRAMPTPVAGALVFASISAGGNHTCGVTTRKRVYCWGQNIFGQLGDGQINTRSFSATPVRALASSHFAMISSGTAHTCGVTVSGRASCWGANASGQLGDGTTSDRSVPAPVVAGVRFTTLSAGGSHTCGLTTSGTAYCWGDNSYGQLGDGTPTQRLRPVSVAGGLTFTTIRAGDRHTCAVTASGAAYCWGYNADGRLGDGTTTQQLTPVLVAGGLGFTAIRAGTSYTCGIVSGGGGAYCWGDNATGQLGTGTQTVSLTPARVVQ
ncbi:MAG TPA: hypothetical protein VM716_13305 [Gemmatimonadales bacterium]|nr:hypothetical protein [Gemmatimonadales bacterium]